MPSPQKLLAIYLQDHLAGATTGLSLAKRTLSNNRDTQFEPFLERLADEIQEDRNTLLDVMRTLDVGEDRVKAAGAFVLERAGRLKLNGALFGYSPLSRLVEFEGLMVGVTGKLGLWRALRQQGDSRLSGFDLDALERRAVEQRDGIEEQRLEAARIAFSG